MKKSILALLFLFPIVSFAALKPGGHVTASLVSEVRSIQPGTPFWVAVRLEMMPKWHTYWKNPGDSGAPTEIAWNLPNGFKASAIHWPAPERIAIPPVVSHGYENEVLLLVEITPPKVFTNDKPVPLKAHIDWLECELLCIPGQAEVALTLPVKISPPMPDPAWQEKFSQARFRWPLASSEWTLASFETAAGYRLTLTPPAGAAKPSSLYFFVEDPDVISYSAPQTVAETKTGFTIDFARSDASTETARALNGILVNAAGWRGPNSETALQINVPVQPASAAPAPISPAAGSRSLAFALVFAFIGGLILNLMPCVLPVLSIKVLGFVKQANEDHASILKHGLVFAGGVLVSFWTLAGLLLFLRAGGQQLGWGFQLQSPVFVACLISLFFILGLSLLGIFEIGTSFIQLGSEKKTGLSGSFLSGVLATIVATPCTAPFMGSALGFALTQPAYASMAIFTALGLGMASPYVLLAANPALLKFVPKAGAWMETFKQAMGFLMIATVLWLLWVIGNQTDSNTIIIIVLGCLLIEAVGAWAFGRWATPVQSPATRKIAFIFGLGAMALGVGLSVKIVLNAPAPTAAAATASAATGKKTAWESFSEERVQQLRAQGRPVFVDFTARWCLTCQVNERVVLNAVDIQKAFASKNVAMLKADWTSRDENITRALQAHGRSGVPFYLLYPADPNAKPIELAEILTPQMVTDALAKI